MLLQGVYSITKAAMINMTKSFAKEYGSKGIRVNAICPGLVETKMTQSFRQDMKNYEKMVSSFPVGFAGQPDDIVSGILMFASDASRYITGQALVVDGGATV